jgi:hypothetical protein
VQQIQRLANDISSPTSPKARRSVENAYTQ